MHRDGAWSYGPPLSRACWTPSQVAEARHVAVWDPGPPAQALARPSLRYNAPPLGLNPLVQSLGASRSTSIVLDACIPALASHTS